MPWSFWDLALLFCWLLVEHPVLPERREPVPAEHTHPDARTGSEQHIKAGNTTGGEKKASREILLYKRWIEVLHPNFTKTRPKFLRDPATLHPLGEASTTKEKKRTKLTEQTNRSLFLSWRELSSSEGWRAQNRVQLLNTLHTDSLAHMLAYSLALPRARTEHTLFPPGNRKYTNIRARQKETAQHTDSGHTIRSP